MRFVFVARVSVFLFVCENNNRAHYDCVGVVKKQNDCLVLFITTTIHFDIYIYIFHCLSLPRGSVVQGRGWIWEIKLALVPTPLLPQNIYNPGICRQKKEKENQHKTHSLRR